MHVPVHLDININIYHIMHMINSIRIRNNICNCACDIYRAGGTRYYMYRSI